eukprot:NODE_32_length_37098_cov_1.132760.p14 type:complete len:247 gc:universal NODE_32_length_37098_cov_1.132760:35092-35832(+)
MLRFSRSLKTHFGFQNVESERKAFLVQDVFSKVANKYDLMNDFMSLGVHRCWKSHFVKRLSPLPNMKVLDVAGGTGDVAFKIHRLSPYTQIEVVDLNKEMLNVGENKNSSNLIKFTHSNAEDLKEIESDSRDVYCIVFGIRNCTHIDKVIKEAHRVLRRGGRIMVMEFSKVHPLLQPAYDWYSFNIIPQIGKYVSNDEASYKYLVESIRMFPSQDDFQSLMAEHFTMDKYEDLTGGIATIWSGYKI